MSQPNHEQTPDVIALHPADNILVVCRHISPGDTISLEGTALSVNEEIPVGHKVSRYALQSGEKIIKYGAPIGSTTAAIAQGEHVHLHNMKSDYIDSYTRDVISAKQSL